MNNAQLYKRGFWLLLILNVLVLFNFLVIIPLYLHPKNPPKVNTEKLLKLNQEQTASFEKFANLHHQQIMRLNDDQKSLIPIYFSTLYQPNSPTNRDSLASRIQSIESQKLEVTYKHFEDIKSILNPDQIKDFPQLVESSLFRVLAKNQAPKGRKRDR